MESLILEPSAPLQAPAPKRPRPLSYEDLRRFLFLCLAIALGAFIISKIGRVVMLFAVIVFLAMILNPFVVFLEKRGIRRAMGVGITMLGLIATMIGAGFLVVPPMAKQVGDLYEKRNTYTRAVENQLDALLTRYPQLRESLPRELRDADRLRLEQVVDSYAPQLSRLAGASATNVGQTVVQTLQGFIGAIFTLIIALLGTAFVLANPTALVGGMLSAVPTRHRDATGRAFARIETQMIAWIRATLITGAATGLQTAILLYFIGLPSVIVFAVLAFFGEFVPNIGPIVTSIPALFVAAGLGPTKFLLTLAAILFVQNISSSFLVPMIMGKELELHPATIIFFALSMGALFGVIGAVLAVPLAAISKILFDEFYAKPNNVPREKLETQAKSLVEERVWKS